MVEPIPRGESLERHFISCTAAVCASDFAASEATLASSAAARTSKPVCLGDQSQASSVSSPDGFQTSYLACSVFLSSKRPCSRSVSHSKIIQQLRGPG